MEGKFFLGVFGMMISMILSFFELVLFNLEVNGLMVCVMMYRLIMYNWFFW